MEAFGRLFLVIVMLLALAGACVAPAMAQDKSPAGEIPASIPVPEIAKRADEVSTLLRDLDTFLASNADVEAIRQRLPELQVRIDAQQEETKRAIEGRPPLAVLDGLMVSWKVIRGELVKAVEVLTERATRLEQELERLQGLLDSWTRTRTEARNSRAPAPVFQRIDNILKAIPEVQKRLREQRGVVLVLQDQVAKQLTRLDSPLDQVAQARQGFVGQLFDRDALPIWSTELRQRVWTDLSANAPESLTAHAVQFRDFVRQRSAWIPFLVLVFAGLALLLRMASRRVHLPTLTDERGVLVGWVFARPMATALTLIVLASFWLYPQKPRAVTASMTMVALVAGVRVMGMLLEPWQARWLYALGAFYLIDVVRGFFAVVPLFEHELFLLEMLIGAVAAGWLLHRNRAARLTGEGGQPRRSHGTRVVASILLGAFSLAALAAVAGYMSLGRLVGIGTLTSAYAALALYTAMRVGYGLIVLMLRVWPLRLLRIVQRHRALVEQRAFRLLHWLAWVGWALATLAAFALLTPFVAMIRRALTADLSWGSLNISLGDVLAFALTVWLAFLLSAFVRFVLEEDVYPRVQIAPGLPYAVSTVLHYAILFAGFLLAVAALGLDLNKVTFIGGAFGVGIGFGLQNVVNNFVSGLIVLFERPIHVGDSIQIGDLQGEVRRIGIRSSTVRTGEGAEVIVPNSILVSDKVINWTPADRVRRIDVPVGAAYGSSPEKVLDLLREVARTHPQVLSAPAPLALFLGFGESALRFELRVWTGRLERFLEIKSELGLAVYAALSEAGIEIPFPQREVRMRRESTGDA